MYGAALLLLHALGGGDADPRVIELAIEALAADQADRLDECIAKDREALAIADSPIIRLHLASCLSRSDHLIESLRAAKEALELAMQGERDERTERVIALAQKRIGELLERIPHVSFKQPSGAPSNTTIEFDGRPVPPSAAFTQRFAVDPGEHVIEARGGDCLVHDEHVVISPAEDRVILIELQRLPELDEHCRPVRDQPMPMLLFTRIGLEMSAYTDTTKISVLTPALNATVSSPTHGWSLGASYAVDVVSSASPDVVSTASPGYRETRHVVTAKGAYKPSNFGVELRSKVSAEPDCLSITGGGALVMDLDDKLVSPRIGYARREDQIGIAGTSFSAFEHQLSINEFEAGAAVVLSPTTIFVTALTLETMRAIRRIRTVTFRSSEPTSRLTSRQARASMP